MSEAIHLPNPKGIARYQIAGHEILLHPNRAAYICDQEVMICSDLHIGKTMHFRKHGIPVPNKTAKGNYWRLVNAVECFRPREILFLGDIIHSKANKEWDEFIDVLEQFPRVSRVLIRGNHDVESDQFFQDVGFDVCQTRRVGNLRMVHEPDGHTEDGYTIAGHLHPSVSMRGRGRQSLRLPCFWFGKHTAVMPAFGEFTGTARISPDRGDTVFVVAENQVIRVN